MMMTNRRDTDVSSGGEIRWSDVFQDLLTHQFHQKYLPLDTAQSTQKLLFFVRLESHVC